MAEAKVIREAVALPPVKEVVLSLTDEEAAAVAALLGSAVADYPFVGIYHALRGAGYGLMADGERHERLQARSGVGS